MLVTGAGNEMTRSKVDKNTPVAMDISMRDSGANGKLKGNLREGSATLSLYLNLARNMKDYVSDRVLTSC
jgi:hypothetical protein